MLAVAHTLQSLLFGISAFNPLTFIGVVGILSLAARSPAGSPPAAPRRLTPWWRCVRNEGTTPAGRSHIFSMCKLRPVLIFLCLATLGSALDQAAYTAAVELYSQRKPLEAQKAFETLAATEPRNADIQFYLGRLALQRDDHEKAVAYLEKAVALSSNDARYHHRLGDAYGLSAQKAGIFSKMGLASKCKAEYEKAVELDPRNIEARLSLMSFYQQAPGFAGGSVEKALEQAREVKKLDVNRGRIAVATVYA
ncbi:MAG TPA: tetratricopeptide repeat protein, partial [Vicinamibacteria bacterium]|nr:tetratricopeptide repeat protein [Vicinamibacteria bacterium]